MKKIAFFILLCVLSFQLFSKPVVMYSFDERSDELVEFEKKLVKRLDNFNYEGNISFLSFSDSILTLSVFEKEYRVPIKQDYIERAIDSILLYNDYFDSKSDIKIDYIYKNTISSLSKLKRGELYYAKDNDGKIMSLLVSDSTSDITQLSSLYSRDLVPLLKLEKTSPWFFSINGGFVFTPKLLLSGEVKVKNTSIFYPFNPIVKFKLSKDSLGRLSSFEAVGIGSTLPLSKIFPSSISLLRNSSINGECFLYIGQNPSLIYGAGWEIYLLFMVNQHIGLNVGFENFLIYDDNYKYYCFNSYELKVGVSFRWKK